MKRGHHTYFQDVILLIPCIFCPCTSCPIFLVLPLFWVSYGRQRDLESIRLSFSTSRPARGNGEMLLFRAKSQKVAGPLFLSCVSKKDPIVPQPFDHLVSRGRLCHIGGGNKMAHLLFVPNRYSAYQKARIRKGNFQLSCFKEGE